MRPDIDYGRRSAHDAIDWLCECKTLNRKVRKLIFDVPTFVCPSCKRKYLNCNNYDFCLADVTVNGKQLVQKVMNQGSKPECLPYAICQAMQIMHSVDSLLKNEKPNPRKLKLDPAKLYCYYYKKYPHMKHGYKDLGIVPNGYHKFIRITQKLRHEGIEIGRGQYYRIGEVCSIPSCDYERMCMELADGVPLLAVFTPGILFGGLEYCRMYFPADPVEAMNCNEKPEPHETHAAHMVVLIGVASRIDVRGFFFINSHGEIWCPRKILEEMPPITRPLEFVTDWWLRFVFVGAPRIVRGGIGKVHESGLPWNVFKLCHLDESGGKRLLADEEEEDETLKYETSDHNYHMFFY